MGTDQTPPTPPSSATSRWAKIVAIITALGAVIGFSAKIYKDWSTLPTFSDIRTAIGTTIVGDNTPLTLNNVKLVSLQLLSPNIEVVIEAVASKKFVKNCKADLDLISPSGRVTGSADADNDKQKNGYKKFAFTFPGPGTLPDDGKLRLRCDDYTTDFFEVEGWPARTKIFDFVIGEHDGHQGPGEIRIDCGVDPATFARSMAPDICKVITTSTVGSTDGNRCGYTHVKIRCSTK